MPGRLALIVIAVDADQHGVDAEFQPAAVRPLLDTQLVIPPKVGAGTMPWLPMNEKLEPGGM